MRMPGEAPGGGLRRVHLLYVRLRGRPADPIGLSGFVSLLTNGGRVEDVIVALASSAENFIPQSA